MFEYGSVRKKNANTVLIKTLVIMAFACFTTYTFGFALAYGDSYFVG